jgi:alkylation response protein AidB-like acyl-CoA dehydrogenase
MDFHFSEEQAAIRDLAHEILQREATPERIKAAETSAAWMDEALWKILAEANLLGVALPEAHGGMGFGFAELCLLLEQVGRATAPLPALATLTAALPLAEFGSDAQQAAWLPKVVAGEAILTAALEDAESGDAAAPATRARAEGDGFVLDGQRRRVAFAATAAAVLVPATADDGVAIFLVDPRSGGVGLEAGVTSTGEPLFEMTLAGVRVPAEARLGGSAVDGAAAVRWLEERTLVALAALQAGVAARALEITADYAREREQFGVPIGSFQAVQHRCADAFIDVEAMCWTLWRAAWRLDEGLPASREAWVAKFWAADAGARVANAAIHLHGGLGSDVDYPIHRHFLWSKALELCLGGAGPQLARLGRDMARTGPLLQESA